MEIKIGISAIPEIDSLSLQILKEIQRVRKTGLTFAPEAGSQRPRNVINKGITEMTANVQKCFHSGWRNIKLYFMIGLPTETDEDILSIKKLVFRVIDEYHKVPGNQKGKGLNITVSASTFVPKPFTPFQWEPQSTQEEIYAKQKLLALNVEKKSVTLDYHDPKTSLLEAVFARGDRRLSRVLKLALEEGCKFDGWIEHFDFDKWMSVFKKADIDPAFYANRRREMMKYCHGIILM